MHTKLTAGFQSAFSFLSLSPQAFPASPFWRWQCSRSPPNRRHIVCFCLPQGGLKLVEAFSPDVDHFLSKIYGHTLRPLLTNFAVVNVLDGKTLTKFFHLVHILGAPQLQLSLDLTSLTPTSCWFIGFFR